jgi:magnesium transporter
VFLRDTYDHAVQLIDNIETLRDVVGGLMELYVSNVSMRMNEVMKVLTVVGTIFIPLTFIVGVYGMNFRFMPELDWPWAYPALWAIMIAIGGGMVVHFHRRGWL